MPEQKTCTGCGETKPHSDYYQHKRDGLRSRCRECERVDRVRRREERSASNRAWVQANPEAVKAHGWASSYRRRMKIYGHEPIVETITYADVVARYGDRCWHCGTGTFDALDHWPEPVRDGGPHLLENTKPCCAKCSQIGNTLAGRMRKARTAD